MTMTEESPPVAPPPRPPARAVPHLRNVISNWGAFVFAALVNIFLSPFVVRTLGTDGYGSWVLIGSLVAYLGLLDLGIRGAVMRYVARLHAAENHDESSRFASAGLFLFTIAGAIAALATVGLAFSLERYFDIPPEMASDARLALIILGLTISLSLVSGVFGGVITAMQRFDLSSAVDITVEIGRVIAIVAVLATGQGIVGLAIVQLVSTAVRLVAGMALAKWLYPELRYGAWSWNRSHIRQIIGFSTASSVLHITAMVILQTDAVIIGAYLPVSAIAFFGVASSLTTYARSLVAGLSQTITPRVSALEGAGEQGGANKVALASGRFAGLILLPMTVTFIIRGDTFIGLWMGQEFAESSGAILAILSVGLWFAAGRQVISATLMGLGKHWALVPSYVVEAVANLGLSILWISSYGIIGVAWGSTVPAIFFSIVVIPVIFGRALNIPVMQVQTDLWILPSLAVIPFAVGTYFADFFWAPESLLVFFAQVIAMLPLAMIGTWWIGLTAHEREVLAPRLPGPLRARLSEPA